MQTDVLSSTTGKTDILINLLTTNNAYSISKNEFPDFILTYIFITYVSVFAFFFFLSF